MRRALILSGVGCFAIGTLAGRFLIPLMEPHEIHHVALRADPVLDTCTLHLEHTTTVLGRLMSLGDEIDTLGCSEIRDFPDTWLHCRCSYRDDDRHDGGE